MKRSLVVLLFAQTAIGAEPQALECKMRATGSLTTGGPSFYVTVDLGSGFVLLHHNTGPNKYLVDEVTEFAVRAINAENTSGSRLSLDRRSLDLVVHVGSLVTHYECVAADEKKF